MPLSAEKPTERLATLEGPTHWEHRQEQCGVLSEKADSEASEPKHENNNQVRRV